jgi:hypothetical protein
MIWDFKAGSIEDLLSLADDPIFRYPVGFESVIRLVVASISLPEIKIILLHFRMRKIVEPPRKIRLHRRAFAETLRKNRDLYFDSKAPAVLLYVYFFVRI